MPRKTAPSLGFLVAVVVLIPVLAISAILLWIGNLTARRLSDQLGDRMLQDATRSVGEQVKGFLTQAMRTGAKFERRVQQGSLSVEQLDQWPALMLDVLTTNHDIAAITLGKPNNDSIYLQRMPYGLEVCEARGDQDVDLQYLIDDSGKRSEKPNRVYDYLPTVRPWYQIAIQSSAPRWTPVYTWFAEANTDATIGTAYVIQTYDRAGKLNGVLCVDVTLDGLSAFLKSIVPNQSSLMFLVDEEQLLVATSKGHITSQGERTSLGGSDDALTSAIGRALYVQQQQDSTAQADHRLTVNGEIYRVRIEDIAPFPGINWRVIAALPERELLAEARDTQRRSILLALIVATGGVVLAIFQARRISMPIVSIHRHTDKIASGDFESKIKVKGARELRSLSENLNRMSDDLKNHVELMQSLRMATQVQQSLLPRKNPSLPRLDVHGVSRYCDQTGGDYYDFVETTTGPQGELMIAVGDVMGHGIGAAMFMSCARGAVRASLLENIDVAETLSRVNHVLEQTESGFFMTMMLICINPEAQKAVWASGGHDPAVVYDLQADQFRELEGAEPPLGILADIEFKLYSAELRAPLILMIGTDGIWESKNEAGEFYGKEKMMEIIRKNAEKSAREIGDALEADLIAFRGKAPILDDVTFVIVRML